MMRFRGYRKRTESFIRSPVPEDRRRIPWGKYVYIAILSIVVIGLGRSGIHRLAFIEGRGVVDAERVQVEGNLTGRITSIECWLNRRISRGEPVVVLDPPDLRQEYSTKELEMESELRLLQKQRDQREIESEELRTAYERAEALFEREAIPLPDLLQLERERDAADRELAILQTRVRLAERRLRAFREEYRDRSGDGQNGDAPGGGRLRETVLYAPVDGLVTQIYMREGEVARVGEPIVEIADLSGAFIRAYFDGREEGDIVVGEEVTIEFQNGIETTGRIRRVRPATLPLPNQFLNPYERQERYIIAEITPVRGTRWPAILDTRATVRLMRSWI